MFQTKVAEKNEMRILFHTFSINLMVLGSNLGQDASYPE
jgi:hypothetical protein